MTATATLDAKPDAAITPASKAVLEFRAASASATEIEARHTKLQERLAAAEAQRDEARAAMKALLLAETGANVSEAQAIIRQAEEEISALTDAISELGSQLGVVKLSRDYLSTSVRLEAAAAAHIAEADCIDAVAAELDGPVKEIAAIAARLAALVAKTPPLVTFDRAIDGKATHDERVVGAVIAEALAKAYPAMFVEHPSSRVRERGFVVERFFRLDQSHPTPHCSLDVVREVPAPSDAAGAIAALVSNPLRDRARTIVAKRDFDPKRERTINLTISEPAKPERTRWLPEGETVFDNTLESSADIKLVGQPVGITQRFVR